jgi:hypothetical protein
MSFHNFRHFAASVISQRPSFHSVHHAFRHSPVLFATVARPPVRMLIPFHLNWIKAQQINGFVGDTVAELPGLRNSTARL